MTEYSTSDDAWAALQWNRPEHGDGILLAFRRDKAAEAKILAASHGLDPEADYEISYEDYGLTLVKSGSEIMSGIEIKIPDPRGSLLVKYRRR
ncbi:MAG: hypothetical protein PHI34_10085 [Acidobacteriota bacterium]|nr:hypothetical protein [Acidobacteriota bacterium]